MRFQPVGAGAEIDFDGDGQGQSGAHALGDFFGKGIFFVQMEVEDQFVVYLQ